jgi:membrane associated rhomboid family serine protease
MRKLGRDTSAVIPILVINLVFTFAVPGISIAGHLGGMVIGGIVAVILAYAPRTARTAVQAAGCTAVVILLAVATIIRTAALL